MQDSNLYFCNSKGQDMLANQLLILFFQLWVNSTPFSSHDHVLKHHFKVHNQENWDVFESLTAKGEWHIGPADYFVDYYIKQPNKWAAVGSQGNQRLISNKLYAGTSGIDEVAGTKAFLPEEALTLSFVWNFGSPLFPIADQLEKKESVEVDQKPCHWYQYNDENFLYDFFITKSDHLFYKVSISSKDQGVIGTTTIAQYRKFGPYEMPSQVIIKTKRIDYLMVFTDYVVGDYVSDRQFSFE
jgi:hypothetical protein